MNISIRVLTFAGTMIVSMVSGFYVHQQAVNDTSNYRSTAIDSDMPNLESQQASAVDKNDPYEKSEKLFMDINKQEEKSDAGNFKEPTWDNDSYAAIFDLNKNSDFMAMLSNEDHVFLNEDLNNMPQDLRDEVLLIYWSKEDPASAWDWVISNPDRVKGNRAEFKVMYNYIKNNIRDSEVILLSLPGGTDSIRSQALQANVNDLIAKDPELAKKWPDSFGSDELRSQSIYEVASMLIQTNASDALGYLKERQYELPPEAALEVAGNIGSELFFSSHEVDESFDLISQMDPPIAAAAASGFISVADNLSSSEVNKLIERLPIEAQEKSIQSFINNKNQSDYAGMLDLANQLSAANSRASAFTSIVSKWIASDNSGEKSQLLSSIENSQNLDDQYKENLLRLVSMF